MQYQTRKEKSKKKKENVLSIWLKVRARHLEKTRSSPRPNFYASCQVQHFIMLYMSKNGPHTSNQSPLITWPQWQNPLHLFPSQN